MKIKNETFQNIQEKPKTKKVGKWIPLCCTLSVEQVILKDIQFTIHCIKKRHLIVLLGYNDSYYAGSCLTGGD